MNLSTIAGPARATLVIIIGPWFALALCAQSASVAPAAAADYWQQEVHYQMNVTLDPLTHLLTGTSRIRYCNNSPDTLDRLYLYLYPNAFRDSQSTYVREAARFYDKITTGAEASGWIHINEFRFLPKRESTAAAAVSAFEVKDTILEARLPEALSPGEEITVELAFTSKIKKFQDRSGYRGEQFDFAQWYPKVCVYDDQGWHAEPFHYLGEFYGEFGTFEVTLHVPFEYIVVATGEVAAGDPGWSLVTADTALAPAAWQQAHTAQLAHIAELARVNKRRSVTFHAENVHDFAWLACPDFLYEHGEYDGIPIHILYRSAARAQWTKVVAERGRRALAWLSTKFGRYPYPQVSITHGLLGGGMEYPMLVMNSGPWEGLILHEVGHIYFYGIFGNNEQQEAWLDEGFTSFQTRWYMETRYGRWGYDREQEMKTATWLQRHRPALTDNQNNRAWALRYMTSGYNEPIARNAYQFKNPLGYGVNAYTKGSIFYEMLRYVVGEEAFQKICTTYFERWALKHVNEARFRQVCEEISGMDLGWFFQEWLHDTPNVDYRLGHVRKQQEANGAWQTTVEINRLQNGRMPVEVEMTLDNGEKVAERWDGQAGKGTLSFKTAVQPRRVVLDPQDQIMDKSRLGHGDMRVEVYPQYPRIEQYQPNDAYVLTWKPGGWYNDLDGLRLGLNWRSHYRDRRQLELGAWYGFVSSTVDGTLKYSDRLGTHWRYGLSGSKLEGRYLADAHVTAAFSRAMFLPPQWNLTAGFSYEELPQAKTGYAATRVEAGNDVVAVPNWSPGKVNQAYLKFEVNPRGVWWQSFWRVAVAHAAEALGSDASFTRLESELRFWIPMQSRNGVYLRLFGGTFLQQEDDKPLQYLFAAFGANGREQFEKFYTRSRGALPAELHYHLPGGGNLRGYYDQPDLAGKSLLAGNLELRRAWSVPGLGKLVRPLLGRSTFTAFFDYGSVALATASDTRQLADAGLGVIFEQDVPDNWYSFFVGTHYTLRLDVPFWVSSPRLLSAGAQDDEVKLRYLFSLQRAW